MACFWKSLLGNTSWSWFYILKYVRFALQVLATICEEMPSDGVLLIYLSAAGWVIWFKFCSLLVFYSSHWELQHFPQYQTTSGSAKNVLSSPAGTDLGCESINNAEDIDKTRSPCGQVEGGYIGPQSGCLSFGARGRGGILLSYRSKHVSFWMSIFWIWSLFLQIGGQCPIYNCFKMKMQ